MIYLIYESATGYVVGNVVADATPRVLAHHDIVEVPALVEYDTVKVIDGAIMQIPPHLPSLRAARWLKVKSARDRAEWSGCMTMLGRVDTDPDSQRKVSGSVQMAMIAQGVGAPFDLAWTMQDNGTVIHDAPAMIAMGVAVGQHVAACHAVAIGKRDAIDAAADAAAIVAIDIEGGWPNA